jgi:hypothetical protein
MTLEERFWRYVEPMLDDRGCWEWAGPLIRQGSYGQISKDGRTVGSHRVAWELFNGAIPKGLFVCRRCDNPPCVNPSHLFLGTPSENSQDALRKRRQYVGEKNVKAKLTEADVIAIKVLIGYGYTQRYVAKIFGVHYTTARDAFVGRSWGFVLDPTTYLIERPHGASTQIGSERE